MRTIRQSRILCFKLFFADAVEQFTRLAEHNKRHHDMAAAYSFNIVPGGRYGGQNQRIVDVFYGNRPFDVGTTQNDTKGNCWPTQRLLTESGASLSYERGDNGLVLCTLRPARSVNLGRKEDAVILSIITDARDLTGRSILEKHFRYLVAYMRYSSLDGEPTLWERIDILWILFIRPTIIAGTYRTPAIWTWLGRIISVVITVGLSGFIITIIQYLHDKPSNFAFIEHLTLLVGR